MAYVIYKSVRGPRNDSYCGPSWDTAGIREQYREQYDTEEEALALAKKLTEVNPVGFKVAKVL